MYEDGKMFLRRLQWHLDKQSNLLDGQKKFRRITVAEQQGEGHGNSWHLHILLIFEDTAPYIANEVIADLWGFGITDTHKVYDADGLALYFKAYLSDVEYITDGEDSNIETVEKLVDGVSKQFIKGEQILICIARRLVNIVYGMLKNKTEYRNPSAVIEKFVDKSACLC